MNSCNPIFISLGQDIGVSTFYRYLEKFGLLSKTGIDISRRSTRSFLKRRTCGSSRACNTFIWTEI